MGITEKTLKDILEPSLCSGSTYKRFVEKLAESGGSTRDENPQSHFCAYFLPFNQSTKELFIIHHKKSGKWLSPGGHIDKDESIIDAVTREVKEELGFDLKNSDSLKPFLLTITPIENEKQPCKIHFDVWYRIETDGSDFNVDPKEFLATKWSTVADARKIVNDPANMEALDRMEEFFSK